MTAQDERAAVVAYLRGIGERYLANGNTVAEISGAALLFFAIRLERGEHLAGEELP